MQSNPIRGEWEQHRRGTGNSNFVQLVPAVTSPHLNEPLDNPQKYDPTERGSEAVSPLSLFPAERLLTGFSPLRVEGQRGDTDEPGGTRGGGSHALKQHVMANTCHETYCGCRQVNNYGGICCDRFCFFPFLNTSSYSLSDQSLMVPTQQSEWWGLNGFWLKANPKWTSYVNNLTRSTSHPMWLVTYRTLCSNVIIPANLWLWVG